MGTTEFNSLLVDNSEFLKPFAVTLTRDNETAHDLLQDTMYRALANKEKYHVGTNIKAWLYTIMRNIFINNYRKQSKYQVVSFSKNCNMVYNPFFNELHYQGSGKSFRHQGTYHKDLGAALFLS